MLYPSELREPTTATKRVISRGPGCAPPAEMSSAADSGKGSRVLDAGHRIHGQSLIDVHLDGHDASDEGAYGALEALRLN